MTTFLLWVIVLAALLFWPLSRLIWVLSVRRLQNKLGRELSEAEIAGQWNRARLIAAVVALVFSWMFNLHTLGPPTGG